MKNSLYFYKANFKKIFNIDGFFNIEIFCINFIRLTRSVLPCFFLIPHEELRM